MVMCLFEDIKEIKFKIDDVIMIGNEEPKH